MSRSASNAAGHLVENAWAPVKSAVRDGAKICMGERPGENPASGTGASPEGAPGPSKPGMQQVRILVPHYYLHEVACCLPMSRD
jgi:hypothetical protein